MTAPQTPRIVGTAALLIGEIPSTAKCRRQVAANLLDEFARRLAEPGGAR